MAHTHTNTHIHIHTHGNCRGKEFGWQQFLMTFWSIISMSEDYTIHFSGANPNTLRLHFIRTEPELTAVIKIAYPKSPGRIMVWSIVSCFSYHFWIHI
jgi:hypothetical protein